MKRSALAGILFSIVSFVSAAHAQDADTKYLYNSSDAVAQGFRLGIMKAFMDAELKIAGFVLEGDLEQEFGVKAGYAHIQNNSIGVLGHLTYNQFEGDASAIRADVNAAFGMMERIFVYGGINLNKVDFDGGLETDLGLGFQVGVGVQFTPNVGIDLAYLMTRNEIEESGVTADFDTDGLEVTLAVTF